MKGEIEPFWYLKVDRKANFCSIEISNILVHMGLRLGSSSINKARMGYFFFFPEMIGPSHRDSDSEGMVKYKSALMPPLSLLKE